MTPSHVTSPSNIHRELARIWDSLEGTKMRACLFNLIFYTQKEGRSDYIQKIAMKVIERFPSRILMITTLKNAPQDHLTTKVSVLSPNKADAGIACDLIELEVSEKMEERVPFILLPHIIPDLPIYLVWAEDPALDNPLLFQLEKFATRLIFDSEATDHLTLFAKSLLDQEHHSCTDIADLNWARIEDWRDLLSAAFHSENRLEQLLDTKSIRITYNASESPFFCHTQIQSLYLQGWLGSQLNWKFQSVRVQKKSLLFTYSKEKDPVEIELEPAQYQNLPAGMIIRLDLKTYHNWEISLSRDEKETHQIIMQVSNPEICELPTRYTIPKAESGQSLVKEICRRGTSAHYLKVLTLITKMDIPKC